MKKLTFAAAIAVLGATGAYAGTIESACLKSDRKASRQLCGCIQEAADLTLTGRDQKVAAAFFRDPHKAQETRQSDRRSDESFWQRYKEFGTTAEVFCSGV
ncbi:hypothetical protein [Actibacterium sp. XHP0104]|uniref:hypothetical protein n=1 Tax=Actibacterium sp. XHP0104 TaxID=2984335 RepID=UPI0021E97154|nr:hypothetical protein [Actibacterium sp. XHP0104]MCV2882923.1 hypothetical protein [Actibacterium sp. XHP0104]